ncbi:Scr1 family TA system antitoxin-like transcriptional regulator [Pilimelia anulata]|uniref:Scr1 family TA system antitoxin-like transcriptional regulator n=1 Tax=Pilimelia anulata TaxID=53371 RepID=UPI0035714381
MLAALRCTQRSWRARLAGGLAAVQLDYHEAVAASRVVASFETAYVPDLLQIPDYARAVFADAARRHALGDAGVADAVRARLARQPYLYDPAKRFEFLLTPMALGYLVAPPAVMRAQLDRLLSVIGLPGVRFGVMPVPTAARRRRWSRSPCWTTWW